MKIQLEKEWRKRVWKTWIQQHEILQREEKEVQPLMVEQPKKLNWNNLNEEHLKVTHTIRLLTEKANHKKTSHLQYLHWMEHYLPGAWSPS